MRMSLLSTSSMISANTVFNYFDSSDLPQNTMPAGTVDQRAFAADIRHAETDCRIGSPSAATPRKRPSSVARIVGCPMPDLTITTLRIGPSGEFNSLPTQISTLGKLSKVRIRFFVVNMITPTFLFRFRMQRVFEAIVQPRHA